MLARCFEQIKSVAFFLLICAVVIGGNVNFARADNGLEVQGPTLQIAVEEAAADGEIDVNDPIEPVNRFFFHVMQMIVETMFKPVTLAYIEFTPDIVQEGVDNFLENLKEPVNIANNLLQGDVDEATNAVGRLLINTTVGIGGINDVTGELGHDRRREDFGQTLAVWGVGEGPYLFIPLWGPTNPRDFVGQFFVDSYFDPVGLWFGNAHDDYSYVLLAMNAINSYGEVLNDLEQVKKSSVDYYAAIRSLYRQKRKSQIANGADVDLPPLPELSIEFDEEEEKDEQASVR